MRQDADFLRAIPARVVGLLSRDDVYVTAYPGMRADEGYYRDGVVFHAKFPVRRDAWPQELLWPNADVWLIYQSDSTDDWGEVIDVCPRADTQPPDKYRVALAEAEEARKRKRQRKARWEAEATQRALDQLAEKRWWQFWR